MQLFGPESFPWGLALLAVVTLLLLAMARAGHRLYQVRTFVRKTAREHNIPMLPHSFLFGHLVAMGKVLASEPRDIAGHTVPSLLKKHFPDLCSAGVLYVDTWPVHPAMCAVFHPDLMVQFTQDHNLPKINHLRECMGPLTGGNDLVCQEGAEWKKWRGVFNPGFSAKNLLALVPAMLEEVLIFRSWLKEAAKKGDVVCVSDRATRVTVDVIGRAALGTRLQSQTRTHPLVEALISQISLLAFSLQPLKTLNPLRPLRIWYNNRVMRAALVPLIERSVGDYGSAAGPKTIVSLAVKSYAVDVGNKKTWAEGVEQVQIDPEFLDMVVSQLKIFLFAGHDTTANTLCFIYHLLGTSPSALAKVRAEHDVVFGPDPRRAVEAIAQNPTLLNQLPYTSAVIKETLRLYPVVGTTRYGEPGFFLIHPDTRVRYPTEGWCVFGCSQASQRHESFFPEPHSFVPERWLVRDESNPMYVRRNSWRPFELGPRNCIGQELAQLELRMILAVTLREFDIRSAYPEGGPRVLGELAYQVDDPRNATAHPKGGLPARVSLRVV